MGMPTMDFETYSEAGYIFDRAAGCFRAALTGKPGIFSVSSTVYAEHPSTRVISLAYDLMDGRGVQLWTPGRPVPLDLFRHIWAGGMIEAHNSSFEYFIWRYVCHARMGWPDLPLGQLVCSQARAQVACLPGALGKLTDILQPAEGKSTRGKQLIRLLSVPKKPTKKDPGLFRTFERYPELYYEMYDYNDQDVKAEMSISGMLPEMSGFELKVWWLDQEINARGMAIDIQNLDACIEIFEQVQVKYTQELQHITGGVVQTVGEMAKLKSGDKWLQSIGVNLPSLDKAAVIDVLAWPDLPPLARRALEIRQEIGGASVKKLFAMKRHLNTDGRIRGLFQYCGAERTGRWAGRGPQPQNLRNGGSDSVACGSCGSVWSMAARTDPACPGCSTFVGITGPNEWGNISAEAALTVIRTGSLDLVEQFWGSAVDLIGSCMRSLFIAAPGHYLICSDYSAIEAVVIAALAGEEWRLEVFRTHGKIYEASASQVSGVPLEEILEHKTRTRKHHPLRKRGKIRELANAYGGWIGASKNFGHKGTDDEIKADVLSWREESPMIPELWGGQWRKEPGMWKFRPELYGVEGMFIAALLNPGTEYTYRLLRFFYDSTADALSMTLPSDRPLIYHAPRIERTVDQRRLDIWAISYMGVDSYTKKWSRIPTYGARVVENATQATARDIMASAMVRLDAAGYPIVLHVHDEIIAEVPDGFGSIEEFENIMMQREPWFADWPIKAAGGWRGKRYRK